jgi:hypothetical protein
MVALMALVTLVTAGAGTVLAAAPQADEVVFDAVVTVHWADPDHGPMAGAVVRIFWYHHIDDIHGIVPLGDPIDASGNATIVGVPRPAPGSDPVFLDIFGDLQTSTIDDAGCTRFEGWSAQERGVTAALALDLVLETSARSLSVNCPNPTPRPVPAVVGFPPQGGNVAGVTGRPQITPPATDMPDEPARPVESPLLLCLLALIAMASFVVPTASLAVVRRHSLDR